MNPNISRFVQVMRDSMVGRDDEVRAITLALVSQEHCCLLGPPGTGKSFVVDNAVKASGASAFDILMTQFTTPEEILGPFRLTALQQDQYIRNLADRACEAEVCFFDEIYKGSSAILNSMLKIIQERMYNNGGTKVKCPLRTMVAASNELPEPGTLDALHDRFAIRRLVKPIPKHLRRKLLLGNFPTVQPVCTIADFDQANADAMGLPIRRDAIDTFETIWSELESGGVVIGDRRGKKALKIVKASAYLDGATAVHIEHLDCLVDVFWNSFDEISDVRNTILRHCNPDEIVLNEFSEELSVLATKPPTDKHDIAVALSKVSGMVEKCAQLKQSPKCIAIAAAAQDACDMISSQQTGQSVDTIRRLRETTARRRAEREAATK